MREAGRQFGADDLARSTLYSSTEPCAMCTGAIYAAGIPTIVFGCSPRRSTISWAAIVDSQP